jgi:perosamine synthetase
VNQAEVESSWVPRVSEQERRYVLEVLNSQFRTSASARMTERLESLFAQTFQTRFAVSFTNGTATMHAALVAAGVGPGDEVVVPPLTMASTTFCVLHAGASPVYADINPDTWTIDPNSVDRVATPRTKAIIPVALYGLAPNMDGIMDVARRRELFVLEDDAQCFLGYHKGKVVGSIGHAASFSFQASKHMTTGEGGMLITDDEGLADRVRRFNSLGYAAVGAGAGKSKITRDTIQDPNYERHVSVGYNYRLSELCAAVGLAQLERLPQLVRMRQQVAELYAEAVARCTWLVPQHTPDGYTHAQWTYVLKLEPDSGVDWQSFRQKYKELGGDGIYAAWKLNYLEPAVRGKRFTEQQAQVFAKGLCPVAEAVQPRLLQLKTNYFDREGARRAVKALQDTIAHFGR